MKDSAKKILVFSTLVFLVSGCASTLVQTADTQYADGQFDRTLLEAGGLAMLPVNGVERVSRAVIAAAADSFIYFSSLGIDYTDSKRLAQVIASNDLAASYVAFSQGIDETGLVDPKVLSELQKLTSKRYYIRLSTDRLIEDERYQIERNIRTGQRRLASYDEKSVRVFGQILDAETGEIVWEGTGSVQASESKYTYIEQTEADFYAAAAATLLRGVLGLPAPRRQSLPSDRGRIVDKSEALPSYEHEYKGFLFSVEKCQDRQGSCHTAEVFEPVDLGPEAAYKGLLFWGEYDTIDIGFVRRRIREGIDRYLAQKISDEPSEEIVEEVYVPSLEEIVCSSSSENNSVATMLVLAAETPIHESRRSSSKILAYVGANAKVISYGARGNYTEVCFEDGRGWIESSKLARISG